jgi:hypothetical protein
MAPWIFLETRSLNDMNACSPFESVIKWDKILNWNILLCRVLISWFSSQNLFWFLTLRML